MTVASLSYSSYQTTMERVSGFVIKYTNTGELFSLLFDDFDPEIFPISYRFTFCFYRYTLHSIHQNKRLGNIMVTTTIYDIILTIELGWMKYHCSISPSRWLPQQQQQQGWRWGWFSFIERSLIENIIGNEETSL